ncbi:hypothetical protein [Streptomyces sp. NPDC018947]|uniref:hypothetical protein n=1 Tax=Streptomyces sp. NPDC018947 TaxID=3365054 RepID=UPI00379E695B
MERGRVPRPAAAARRFRHTLSLALLTAALASGCGNPVAGGARSAATGHGTGTPSAAAPGPPPSSSSTQPPVSPAELCVRVVSHWAREVLAGGTYGDYQSMGLSNRQYDVLREAVDAARPVRREQGDRAAGQVIDRITRDRCAGHHRGGGPGQGPWR